MEKKIKRNEIMLVIISLIPIAFFLISWNKLPELMPIHYDVNMVADGFSSKVTAITCLSILVVLMYLLFRYLPAIDPKGKIQKHQKVYTITRFIVAILIGVMGVLFVMLPQQKIEPEIMSAGVCVALAALFIGLGNYLPVIKQNFFIGIRTPWTLSNENVWNKTHRVGGRLFVLGGLIMLFSAFIPYPKIAVAIVITVAIAVAVYLVIYSFYLFKKERALGK